MPPESVFVAPTFVPPVVQSGAELTYLLRHDPDFRAVREEHLVEVGRRIRLKRNIALLTEFLKDGIDGFRFDFYVVSAAPWLVVNSALNGIVPPDHVIGAHFEFNQQTGEIDNVIQVPAGYGKVAAVDSLRWRLGVPSDRVVYVGDLTRAGQPVALHGVTFGGLADAATLAAELQTCTTSWMYRCVMPSIAGWWKARACWCCLGR